MSTNRELLENAAKAAGVEGEYVSWCYNGFKEGIRKPSDKSSIPWNPLTDDGPSLRLAVKLDLAVMPYPVFETPKHSVVVSQRNLEHSRFEVVEVFGNDPYAATRRAVVRAAAEIGKTL